MAGCFGSSDEAFSTCGAACPYASRCSLAGQGHAEYFEERFAGLFEKLQKRPGTDPDRVERALKAVDRVRARLLDSGADPAVAQLATLFLVLGPDPTADVAVLFEGGFPPPSIEAVRKILALAIKGDPPASQEGRLAADAASNSLA